MLDFSSPKTLLAVAAARALLAVRPFHSYFEYTANVRFRRSRTAVRVDRQARRHPRVYAACLALDLALQVGLVGALVRALFA